MYVYACCCKDKDIFQEPMFDSDGEMWRYVRMVLRQSIEWGAMIQSIGATGYGWSTPNLSELMMCGGKEGTRLCNKWVVETSHELGWARCVAQGNAGRQRWLDGLEKLWLMQATERDMLERCELRE